MLAIPDAFSNATEVYKIEFKEYVEATSLLNSKEIGEKKTTHRLVSQFLQCGLLSSFSSHIERGMAGQMRPYVGSQKYESQHYATCKDKRPNSGFG